MITTKMGSGRRSKKSSKKRKAGEVVGVREGGEIKVGEKQEQSKEAEKRLQVKEKLEKQADLVVC